MKKLLGLAKGFFLKPETIKNIVNGVEVVGKNKLDKKKIMIVVTIILAILALTGAISEETFIQLFKDIN